MKRCYVGNFPYDITESELRALFAPRKITEVQIVADKETGRPRGFGFVEFATEEEALDAIHHLHGTDFGGRQLVVNLARERGGKPPGRRRRVD